jgi:hypothetical protein
MINVLRSTLNVMTHVTRARNSSENLARAMITTEMLQAE